LGILHACVSFVLYYLVTLAVVVTAPEGFV
jgi:hypothetical protein